MINRKTTFFGHEITRLIAGDNPFGGHSYIEPAEGAEPLKTLIRGKEMKEFCYDTKKLYDLYWKLEEAGFDCMFPLADPLYVQILKEYKRDGGKMKFIFQSYSPMLLYPMARQLADLDGLISLYLSGTYTDVRYERGTVQEIKDAIVTLKGALDGRPIGFCSHDPELIKIAETEEWGMDYLVCCLHNLRRGRKGEDSGFITGKSKSGVKFYMDDRQVMLDVIKNSKLPCIAYKIFAGGNLLLSENKAENDEMVKKCYREVYSQIKPGDIAAIGMFTKYTDQIVDDMKLYHEVMDEFAK